MLQILIIVVKKLSFLQFTLVLLRNNNNKIINIHTIFFHFAIILNKCVTITFCVTSEFDIYRNIQSVKFEFNLRSKGSVN